MYSFLTCIAILMLDLARPSIILIVCIYPAWNITNLVVKPARPRKTSVQQKKTRVRQNFEGKMGQTHNWTLYNIFWRVTYFLDGQTKMFATFGSSSGRKGGGKWVSRESFGGVRIDAVILFFFRCIINLKKCMLTKKYEHLLHIHTFYIA